MNRLMRFPKAVARDASVEAWLVAQPAPRGVIARRWFAVIRQCGDDVRELMHDGYATACVGDAAFAYVGVFKSHVNVGFFHGAALPDPHGLLAGTGKFMRHVKLRPEVDSDDAALTALIRAAHADIRRRVAALDA